MASNDENVHISDLLIAGSLAFLAGATDVYGLAKLPNVYVSFMSGNTTMLGIALGYQDWARAALIAGILGLFVAGAAAGAAIESQVEGFRTTVVAAAVAALLALPFVRPDWAPAGYVLAMGAQNMATNRIGGAAISLTADPSVGALRLQRGRWRAVTLTYAGVDKQTIVHLNPRDRPDRRTPDNSPMKGCRVDRRRWAYAAAAPPSLRARMSVRTLPRNTCPRRRSAGIRKWLLQYNAPRGVAKC